MSIHKTERLSIVEAAHQRVVPWGHCFAVAFNAWESDDPAPNCLVGCGLLVAVGGKGEWLLSHLLIEDDARGQGFGTELVRFYEERLGTLGACWASESGVAFAEAYMRRFGPRPHWKLAPPPVASGDREIVAALTDLPRASTGGIS